MHMRNESQTGLKPPPEVVSVEPFNPDRRCSVDAMEPLELGPWCSVDGQALRILLM